MEFVPIKLYDLFNASCDVDIKSLLFFSDYHKKYYEDNFEDLSFFLVKESRVRALVLCYEIDNELCLPSDGCHIQHVDQHIDKSITSAIIRQLESFLETYQCKSLVIRDSFNEGTLSSLGEFLFNDKYVASISFDMNISYTEFNQQEFHKNIRKSYKSLLNWGDKNLDYTYINKDNQDKEAFNEFKSFHLKISGRQTRSDETWQAQYELIKQGYGELILGYYDNKLSAGSLFADFGDTSIYFTGVYERELFKFGISHSLLYKGICRSHERGNTSSFSLGLFDTDIQDPKWYNIQFFKKGFCPKMNPTILWKKEFPK